MHNIANSKHKFNNPFFIATVVDNKDPDMSYRVKVRIDVLHDAIENNALPWAAKLGNSFLGMDSSATSHSVPEIGSRVLVLAIGNDPNSLVYLGSIYKKTTSSPTGDNYYNTFGIYDINGNHITLDKIQKLLELVWTGKININNITEMTINVSGNVNINAASTNITAPSNSIKGNVSIDGKLDVTQDITTKTNVVAAIEVTAAATTLTKHTHPGVFPGPSSTGPGVG